MIAISSLPASNFAPTRRIRFFVTFYFSEIKDEEDEQLFSSGPVRGEEEKRERRRWLHAGCAPRPDSCWAL